MLSDLEGTIAYINLISLYSFGEIERICLNDFDCATIFRVSILEMNENTVCVHTFGKFFGILKLSVIIIFKK